MSSRAITLSVSVTLILITCLLEVRAAPSTQQTTQPGTLPASQRVLGSD